LINIISTATINGQRVDFPLQPFFYFIVPILLKQGLAFVFFNFSRKENRMLELTFTKLLGVTIIALSIIGLQSGPCRFK
jgi:hypothetical protein